MYCDFHEIHLIIHCPVYFIWSWFTWYFCKRRPYTYELVVPKMILANMSYLLKEHILSTRLLFYSRLHLKLRKKPIHWGFISGVQTQNRNVSYLCILCSVYRQVWTLHTVLVHWISLAHRIPFSRNLLTISHTINNQ